MNPIRQSFGRLFISVACLLSGFFSVGADVPRPKPDGKGPVVGKPATRAEVRVYQSLLDLESPFTLLSVGVRPGDEDADALAYYRMKFGVRTAILTAHFGERGDNAVTDDFDEALGVLRSRELRGAAEVLDTETYSLGTRDIGPARTTEDVLSRWGREKTLETLVLMLRRVRPDVIVLSAGHRDGQELALRLLVLEARGLAADPTRYPEQFANGLTPWRVRSILEKTAPDASRVDVRFDSNETHPFRRRSYSALALDAIKFEASQGPWPERAAAAPVVNGYAFLFPPAASASPLPDLFADVVAADPIRAAHAALTADLFAAGKPAERWIAARAAATPAETQAANRRLVDDLLKALRLARLQALNDRERAWFFKWFEAKLERAAGLLAGIEVKVTATPFVVVPGEECALRVAVTNSGEWSLILRRVGMTLPPAWEYSGDFAGGVENDIPFDPGQTSFFSFRVRQPDWMPRTRPAAAHLSDPNFLTPQITTAATVVLGNTRFQVGAQTRIELSDPLSIEGLPDKIPVRSRVGPLTLGFSVQRWTGTVKKGKLLVRGTGGVTARPAEIPVTFVGDKAIVPAEIVATLPRLPGKAPGLEWLWVADGAAAKPSTLHRLEFVPVSVAIQPRLRVGIVRGFDSILPRTLDVLGVKHRSLNQADWEPGALRTNFDTVILDRRAYRADPELSSHQAELMDFVERGGRLVVLGQKPDEFNSEWAAFPLELGPARVTRPDAPVKFLAPAHPILTVPNRITPEDFSGWTVERGAFFPLKWDDRYEVVVETGDPGEKREAGGILIAQRGKGRYVYVALDLSRQLRAVHPGCFKLLANLVSGTPGP